MFPLSDSHPTRTIPFVNFAVIALTILVFLLQLSAPDFEAFIFEFGFIPAIFSFFDPSSYVRVISSIFLHAGLFHIIANLWFLHIFGDNVEDLLGHLRYVLFYLATGIAAVFAQYIFSPESTIPMIGASGAISGVAGAYFLLFKHARIKSLVPLGFFIHIVELPSWFFLGYWFILQFFSGIGSLVAYDIQKGGVAYFAHIGGFIAGIILISFLRRRSAGTIIG